MHRIPLWPVIVGIVLGLICLFLIILLLYLNGFFKRKKSVLRKAKFTQGGAEETYAREKQDELLEQKNQKQEKIKNNDNDDKMDLDKFCTSQTTPKKKAGFKNRKHIRILHPSDLQYEQTIEEENLLSNND